MPTHPHPHLQNCDLTGCELQHANLRGSNLTGAILKEIVAPLHMSQTVNVTTVSSQVEGTPPVVPGQLHQGQGTPPNPSHAQVPQQQPHHHNQPGASPPQLQLLGSEGGAVGGGNSVRVVNGSADDNHHTGNAQEQANQRDTT